MALGRKPKPTHLKLLAGNPGHRPLNEDEPQPTAMETMPSPPDHLTDEAKKEWLRIVPLLMQSQMISDVDTGAVCAYCQAYGRWVSAEIEVNRTGLVVTGAMGGQVINPYLHVANKALDHLRKLIIEFGMTPSSRSRVTAIPKKKTTNRFLDLVGDAKK